jgi:hypothetical protein
MLGRTGCEITSSGKMVKEGFAIITIVGGPAERRSGCQGRQFLSLIENLGVVGSKVPQGIMPRSFMKLWQAGRRG